MRWTNVNGPLQFGYLSGEIIRNTIKMANQWPTPQNCFQHLYICPNWRSCWVNWVKKPSQLPRHFWNPAIFSMTFETISLHAGSGHPQNHDCSRWSTWETQLQYRNIVPSPIESSMMTTNADEPNQPYHMRKAVSWNLTCHCWHLPLKKLDYQPGVKSVSQMCYYSHGLFSSLLTLAPLWLIDPYCTFTIYTARYPLVTSAWSYSNIPEF